MNHFYKSFLRLIFGLAFLFFVSATKAQRISLPRESVVSGKILIKLKPGASAQIKSSLGRISSNLRAETFSTGLLRFDVVARQFKATNMVRVFPNAGRMEIKQHKYGLDRWYVVQVDPTVAILTAVNSFRDVTDVETVQPAYTIKSITSPITKITGNVPSKPLDAAAPAVNDPYYYLQWHYHNTGQVGGYVGADINVEPAWKITGGKPNVIVDVVDEGVDFNHEDLKANMWANQAELNGQPGVDDDGNGYVDDFHGYNFGDNTGTILPGDHGTHTSGTIAAVNNNGIGVAGIAGGTGKGDGARIMSSEIFGNNGADGAATSAAIVYGANNGAVISQNSWGYTVPGVYDQLVLDAIDYFTKEAGRDENGNQVGPMNGGLVIFAAGNSDISDPSYPGYYPTAVAVGALSIYDNKASYSNYGDWVDISAPGGDDDPVGGTSKQMVASTVANNKYGYMAGTSMACPHVSGVAALIVSQYGKPGFTNEDLKNRLFHTADPFIAMNPIYNGLMGIGRLDAGRALEADKGLAPVAIADLKGKSNAQNSIDLTWTAPSDPDNANAESYIVYYATHPFDISQKDTLPKMFIKKALTAGTAENFNLSGLHSSTTYFISVNGKDLWGNESAFSNILTVKTMDGPTVTLPGNPISLAINVKTSPIKSTAFKLSNTGLGVMNWTTSAVPVSSSWAKADGFNDTLRWVDQEWVDKFLGDDQRMDFSAATRFDVTKKPFNLTHVANYIQTAGVVAPITIFIYKGGDDPSKGTLVLRQVIDQANDYSLNVTKLNGMFLFQPGEWFWVVYQFDPAYGYGQGAQNNATAEQENYFLTSSNKGQTWKSIASQYEAVRFFMYGLSNEGYPGGMISLLPASGTTPAMGSTTINVNGNATTIRNGVYNFNLIVNSNDLNNPTAGVPLVVTVTGQKGTLTSKESILDCSTVFLGKDGDASIKLYNAGLSTLKKFTFTTDNDKFINTVLPDSLNPGDSAQFTVKFTPTAAGLQLAKIKITTNDGSLSVSASGVGVLPPVMTLKGLPLQIVAKVDSTGKNTFTISNKDGKYPLSYSMPEIAAITKAKIKGKLTRGTDPFTQYVWIDSQEPDGPVYNWTDISTTGTDVTKQLAADPKTSKAFPIGFPMNFYGDTINQVYVNSFGALTLNYPGAMNINNLYLPNPGDGISGLIAGLYLEEMLPVVRGNEHVFIKYVPGKFIVQYNDLEYFDGNFDNYGSFSLGKATFQIVLYSNGKIEINYKKASPNDPSNVYWSAYAQIGLENKAETKGINVNAYDLQPAPFAPGDGVTLWFVPVAPKFITSIKPQSGAVAPGESVKIEVVASADGLVDSTYLTNISLTTNDPLNERMELPVVFTVTGIRGMMKKTDTLSFGKVYKNAAPKMDAVFLNTGTKPVKLLSVAMSNAAFTTDQDTVSVPALSELHIPVTFKPTAENSYKGLLTIKTDDTAHATFTVVLTGTGQATPKVAYTLTGGQTNTLNIGQTAAGSLKITNNGDGDLKIMVQRPQWLSMTQPIMGIANGLDSASTYSVHKNIDSSAASYEWIELANGLGTSSLVDASGLAAEEVKLPFAFPYYGKTYRSLYVNWFGDVTLNYVNNVRLIYPGIPSPLEPNGIIASSNLPLVKAYDWDKLVYIGQIYYYTDADKMVVEFYGMYEGEFGMMGKLTYETIFYKDGRIKMLYKSGEKESNFTQRMVVGIENEDGTDGTLAYNKSLWYKDRGVIEFVPSIPYTIKPGKSFELPATWTTTSMTDGVYKDNLVISTNDPLNASIKIPLQLNVNGTMSIKTTDTVNFGKVVAYSSEATGPKTYTQPVLLKNDGKKTITVTGIDFGGNNSLTLDELNQNPDLFASPLILGPGDEQTYHVILTPDAKVKTLNARMNVSSDYISAISIPLTAAVSLPPIVGTDSTVLHITLQQTDSASKGLKILNTGKGQLDYTMSVQYHRPGITYNSVSPVKPVTPVQPVNPNPKNTVKSLMGNNGPSMTPLGSQPGTVGSNSKFADSIMAFEPLRTNRDYLGTGYDEAPITAASRFNGGKKGFYLSHVGNLYRTDNMIPTTIKFRIRLGSNITTSTIIYEQSVPIQPDTTAVGTYITVKMDSSILINAYEDFWIEWNYAFGMRYPQGMQFIPSDHQKNHTFYTKVFEEYGWSELGLIADFYMAAYAQKDSAGGWLTITPDTGSVGSWIKQQTRLVAHGPKMTPPDQAADLIVHSNDPETPEKKVTVFAHIDQPPTLSNHDTLVVQEADSLNALIPTQDDGGGKVTVRLLKKDPKVTITNTNSGSYFNYHPGYDDAGVHVFAISLTDGKGNKGTDSILVSVLNTNRPPVVVKHLAARTISLNGPALNLPLVPVFTDPDGDALQYSFARPENPIVKVFVDPAGVLSAIPMDTGRVELVFKADDNNGGFCYDTLDLQIKDNMSPVASGIPDVVVDKGKSRTLNLNDYFSDPDGDALTYTATIDSVGSAVVQVSGTDLIINGLKPGINLVTVTADDGSGGTVNKSFILFVLDNTGATDNTYKLRVAPNPVHVYANIFFQLERETKMKIEIVGVNGTLRAVIFNGKRQAGYQNILYNFSHLQTGTYTLKFTIGDDIRALQIIKL